MSGRHGPGVIGYGNEEWLSQRLSERAVENALLRAAIERALRLTGADPEVAMDLVRAELRRALGENE